MIISSAQQMTDGRFRASDKQVETPTPSEAGYSEGGVCSSMRPAHSLLRRMTQLKCLRHYLPFSKPNVSQ